MAGTVGGRKGDPDNHLWDLYLKINKQYRFYNRLYWGLVSFVGLGFLACCILLVRAM